MSLTEFGFLDVWLPYGRKNIIFYPEDGSISFISESDLENEESNHTLVGCDVTVFHPAESALVTSENHARTSVGTALSELRKSPDGNYEVKCRIKNLDVIRMLELGQLTETSASYLLYPDGRRIYNSIALLPPGLAKNGRKSLIKYESLLPNCMNPEDLKTIITGVTAALLGAEESQESAESQMATVRKESFDQGAVYGLKSSKIVEQSKSLGYAEDSILGAASHIVQTKLPHVRIESLPVETIFDLASGLVQMAEDAARAESALAPAEAPALKVESLLPTFAVELPSSTPLPRIRKRLVQSNQT